MKQLLLSVVVAGGLMSAQATVFHYAVSLDGATEFPANASPGLGTGLVSYDDQAHTLELQLVFDGLIGTTTASHIHAPTAVPFGLTNNAGVATTTPSFAGFPSGVTNGTYSRILDLQALSSYNPGFVTANGGTAASAEAALVAAIAAGRAYWNLHSTAFPGGEIRGFLVAQDEPPVIQAASASPDVLHPPNHKMVPVAINLEASDDFEIVRSEIVAVSSNESEGSGPHGDDWEVTGPLSLNLRAERLGKGDGRVYTVTLDVEDDGGNVTTTEVIVTVPKGNR